MKDDKHSMCAKLCMQDGILCSSKSVTKLSPNAQSLTHLTQIESFITYKLLMESIFILNFQEE